MIVLDENYKESGLWLSDSLMFDRKDDGIQVKMANGMSETLGSKFLKESDVEYLLGWLLVNFKHLLENSAR